MTLQTRINDLVVYHWTTRNLKPTILWLHGYTMDGSIWEDIWRELPEFAHVAPDLPGHGRSRRFSENESLSSIARSVEEIAREFDARHIVSISFGGTVGLQLGIQVKGFFKSLTVCSAGIGGGPVDLESQACNRELNQMYNDRGIGAWLTARWLQSPPEIFSGLRLRPPIFEKIAEVIRQHCWQELADGTMNRISSSQQSKNQLKNITLPTLVLVGEQDMDSFKRAAEIIRRSIPSASRKYLPGVGHLGLLEDPGAKAQVLRDFISSVEAMTPNEHPDS